MHIVTAISVISLFMNLSALPLDKIDKEKLSWLTLEEAELACKKEARPVLIDLYTEWCSWCKVMDKKTYSDKNVVRYLNEKFYVVKLNPETSQKLSWQGRVYNFNQAKQTNEIALYFTQGRLAYPTTVFFAAGGSSPQAIPGYLKPRDIEVLLKYFGENNFERVNFDVFQRNFKSSW